MTKTTQVQSWSNVTTNTPQYTVTDSEGNEIEKVGTLSDEVKAAKDSGQQIYRTSDGQLTTTSNYDRSHIDFSDGKVTIYAPKSLLEDSDWVKNNFTNNENFKSLVSEYKADPTGKTEVTVTNSDGTTSQKTLNDIMQEYADAFNEYTNQYKVIKGIKDSVASNSKSGLKLTDSDAIIANNALNKTDDKNSTSNVMYIPKSWDNYFDFSKLDSWDANTRTISAKDWYTAYALDGDNVMGEDTVSSIQDQAIKDMSEYLTKEFSDEEKTDAATEAARVISAYNTLYNSGTETIKDMPNSNFFTDVRIWTETAGAAFCKNLGDMLAGVSTVEAGIVDSVTRLTGTAAVAAVGFTQELLDGGLTDQSGEEIANMVKQANLNYDDVSLVKQFIDSYDANVTTPYDSFEERISKVSSAAINGTIWGNLAAEITKQVLVTDIAGKAAAAVIDGVANASQAAAFAEGAAIIAKYGSAAQQMSLLNLATSIEFTGATAGVSFTANILAQGVSDTILNNYEAIGKLFQSEGAEELGQAYLENVGWNLAGELSGWGASKGWNAFVSNTEAGKTIQATLQRGAAKLSVAKRNVLDKIADIVKSKTEKPTGGADWWQAAYKESAEFSGQIGDAAKAAEETGTTAVEATEKAVINKMKFENWVDQVTTGQQAAWKAVVEDPDLAGSVKAYRESATTVIKLESGDGVDAAGKWFTQETTNYSVWLQRLKEYELKGNLSAAEKTMQTAFTAKVLNYEATHSQELVDAVKSFVSDNQAYNKAFTDWQLSQGLITEEEYKGWISSGRYGDNGEFFQHTARLANGKNNIETARALVDDYATAGNYKAKLAVDDYSLKPGDIDADYLDPQLVNYAQQAAAAKVIQGREGAEIMMNNGEVWEEITADGKPVVKSELKKLKNETLHIANETINKFTTSGDILNYDLSSTAREFTGLNNKQTKTVRKINKLLGLDSAGLKKAVFELDDTQIKALAEEFEIEVPEPVIPKTGEIIQDIDRGTAFSDYIDGNSYATEMSATGRNSNLEGYKRFNQDNLISINETPLDEYVYSTFLKPGGTVDFSNGLLRTNEFKNTEDLAKSILNGEMNSGGVGIAEWVDEMSIPSKGYDVDKAFEIEGNNSFLMYSLSPTDYAKAESKFGAGTEALEEYADKYLVDKTAQALKGNVVTKNDITLYRGLNTGGNKFNGPSDFSWAKTGGELQGNSFQFTTLSKEVAKKFSDGSGDRIVLRMHIPQDTKMVSFEPFGRGGNNGGAFILPMGTNAKIIGEETQDGIKYLDAVVYQTEQSLPGVLSYTGETATKINVKKTPAYTRNIEVSVDNNQALRQLISENKDILGSDTYKAMVADTREKTLTALQTTRLNKYYERYADIIAKQGLVAKGADEFTAAVKGMTDDLVKTATDTFEDNAFAKQLLDSYELAGASRDVAKNYLVLSSFVTQMDNNASAFNKMLDKNLSQMSVSGNLTKATKKNYSKAIKDSFKETVKSEWADSVNAMKELGVGAELIDMDQYYNAVYKEMEGFIDDIVKQPTVISVLDRSGNYHLYNVSPTTATLYKTRPNMYEIKNGAWVRLFNRTNRLFRIGTTGLSTKSFTNQWMRDPLNAYIMGGMTHAIKTNQKEMAELFGEQIVASMEKEMSSAGWEVYTKGLTDEEVAMKAVKEATEGEVANIYNGVGGETAYYRQYQQGYNEQMFGNVTGDEKAWKKAASKMDEWMTKFEDSKFNLGNTRELYLRKSVYTSSLNTALSAGHTLKDAQTIAEFTMRQATTNFSRAFSWGNKITSSVPYLGAAINGSASFWRLLELDPLGVSGRLFGGLIVPTMALTAQSLSNDSDKEIYKSVPEYIKEDNLVFVVNGQLYKMPIPQELSAFVAPFRQVVEKANGANNNSWLELISSDLLSVSPIDLSGFVDLDQQTLASDESFWSTAVGREAETLISQLSPQIVKSAYMMITGRDPYTGNEIDTSYKYFDDDGNLVTMDYNDNVIAQWFSERLQALGINVSPAVASEVLSNFFGTVGDDFATALTSLFNGDISGAVENTIGKAASAFSVGTYNDEADRAWKEAVSTLETKKNALLSADGDLNKISTQMAKLDQSDSNYETKLANLRKQRYAIVQEYQNQVLAAVQGLESKYGGDYDTRKFAATINLMTFSTSYTSGNTQAVIDASQEVYYNARNEALQTMADMGFNSTNDLSIFGYMVKQADGSVKMKTYSPTAIMNVSEAIYGASDVYQADISAIISNSGIKKSEMWDGYYAAKAKGKSAIKAYKSEWNTKVVKALYSYIQDKGVDNVVGDTKTRELIDDYIFIDNLYNTKNYLKEIFK